MSIKQIQNDFADRMVDQLGITPELGDKLREVPMRTMTPERADWLRIVQQAAEIQKGWTS